MTRDGETREFKYDGAERVDDGRFTYRFDRRGRLVAATEKAREGSLTLRRILYEYSPADRIVGRRAEYAVLRPPATVPDDSDWKIEDRAEVIASDALPADTTFVWDPVTDRLVTIADRDANPLRQMIHGDQAYDDPIEVAVKSDRGGVDHLYPLYDEAGAGLLQAIVNDAGEIISRTVIEGPYGEDEFTLTGPAVDHIGASATRTPDGALETVTITIRLTEAIAPETVATGARLATLDWTGATVQTAPVEPTLDGEYTIRWTLTAAEWQSFLGSDTATTLSIGVTNTLRAVAWSEALTVLPLPGWSSLHSSATTPVEYRESIATAAGWFSTAALTTLDLFTTPALSSLGSESASANKIGASIFQALAFAEPMAGLTYARARWMEGDTGVFLAPDPLGNQDSANQYAFAGGDPVNRRDPRGEESLTPDEQKKIRDRYAKEVEACRRDPASETCMSLIGVLVGDEAPDIVTAGHQYGGREASVVYINGVLNNKADARESGELLAKTFATRVDVLWNPTARGSERGLLSLLAGLAADGVQLFVGNYSMERDRTVLQAIRYLRGRESKLSNGERLTVIAHSQGTAIFAAAANYLTRAERSRIDFIAYGEATARFPPGLHSVNRYINVLDPVAMSLGGRIIPSAIASAIGGDHVHYSIFTHHGAHALAGYLEEEARLPDTHRPRMPKATVSASDNRVAYP